jgi:pantetheine-phosphate adenylyltransferase
MSSRRAVYPGSFDPAHYGHIDIVTRAARLFDEVVVAVYDRPAKKVLFDVAERRKMLEEVLGNVPNVRIAAYSGLTVDFMRKLDASIIIRGLRVFSDFELEFRMALANRRLAPDIDVVTFLADERHLHISSSTVREIASLGGDVSSLVPAYIKARLSEKFAEHLKNGEERDYMVSLGD